MIGIILTVGIGIILVLTYMVFFMGNKGRTIYVERFEDHNGILVSLDPKKPIKARQYRNASGIEVLKLPNKYAKEVLEGVGTKHFNNTTAGIPKVRLLKVAEEIYVPLASARISNKLIHTDLIDNRDAAAFYIDEIGRNHERYKNKQSWLEKYGAIAGVAFVGVILLVSIILITKFATEQIDEARAESTATTDKILNTLKGFTGQQTPTEQLETDAARPLGNQVTPSDG